MPSIAMWFEAARPKTLFIGLFPILLSAALRFAEGTLDVVIFFVTLIGALSIQIGTNYSNDYYDFLKGADTSLRKGSKKILTSGLASLSSMKKAFSLFFLLAFICALFLGVISGPFYFFIGVLCILFSLLYTSGPFALAYIGAADFFVLIFYGPVAFLTSYTLQDGALKPVALLLSFIPGLLGLGPLILNNLRDQEEDALAQKRTLIVRFGKKFGHIYYLVIHMIALILSLLIAFISKNIFMAAPCFCFLFYAKLCKSLFEKKLSYHFLFLKNAKIIPLILILEILSLSFSKWHF